MGGMGPAPKDPKLRQRRNAPVATAATLVMPPVEGKTQQQGSFSHDLPPRAAGEVPWHPETISFWKEVWASPMAPEFISADVPGLVLVARLMDRFNYGAVELAAEIRLQRQCFGLTPLDRRRLQWEIERVEAAGRRRPSEPVPAAATGTRDPRRALRAVK